MADLEALLLALAALLAEFVCGTALAFSSAPVAAFVAATADRTAASIDRKHVGLDGLGACSRVSKRDTKTHTLADQDTSCVRIDVGLLEAPPAPPAPPATQGYASAIDTLPTHSASDLVRDTCSCGDNGGHERAR